MILTKPTKQSHPDSSQWTVLDPKQIKQIDRALAEIGEFGEVRLIKSKGRLRFIEKLASEDLAETARLK